MQRHKFFKGNPIWKKSRGGGEIMLPSVTVRIGIGFVVMFEMWDDLAA